MLLSILARLLFFLFMTFKVSSSAQSQHLHPVKQRRAQARRRIPPRDGSPLRAGHHGRGLAAEAGSDAALGRSVDDALLRQPPGT